MISNDVLNQMNADELRNYIKKQNDVIEEQQQIGMADSKIIYHLEQVITGKERKNDCKWNLREKIETITSYEDVMRHIYDPLLDKKVNGDS